MTRPPQALRQHATQGEEMSTTDRLNAAAKKLREHAGAATPGPWESGERCMWSGADVPDGVVVSDGPGGEGGVEYTADAEYIALMSPPVALATAKVLEVASRHVSSNECEAHCELDGCPMLLAALGVADLMLGGQA